MARLLLEHADSIRSVTFCGAVLLMAFAELRRPRRDLSLPIGLRWSGNLGLAVINSTLVRWVMPIFAIGAASIAQQRGWGILGALALPEPLSLPLAVLALDLGEYGIHRIFHALPLLWRLHRVHHADLDVDFTTSQRHHPLEVCVDYGLKLTLVVSLGAPPEAVLIHEALRLAIDAFSHANLKIPEALDRWLRRIVVTPDMHRVHHSSLPIETDSNYANLLPWWDWCFGTYRAQPGHGHDGMSLGLEVFREPRDASLYRILALPFRSQDPPPPASACESID